MKKHFLILLYFWFNCTNATIYHVQISNDNGAPALSVIVQELLLSPPPPQYTLQAFNTVTPSEVRFLIDLRATGNLRVIMDSHPLWTPTRLQQYIIAIYDDNIDTQTIQNSFDNDSFIKSYIEFTPEDLLFPSVKQGVPTGNAKIKNKVSKKADILNVIGTNIQSAWELSEGMGYIGLIDTGVQLNHPDLRAFDDSGNYVGGNLLDAFYQIDTAETTYDPVSGNVIIADLNIDELEPITIVGNLAPCDSLYGTDNDGLTVSSFVGHGTHTAGLIAAKGNQAPGICKNCGFSMMKYTSGKWGVCFIPPNQPDPDNLIKYLFIAPNSVSFTNGVYYSANMGVSVLNFSGGGHRFNAEQCPSTSVAPSCLAMRQLVKREIIFVASAGNDRDTLNFPASDKNTIAAGGLTEEVAGITHYWNDTPNGTDYLDFSDNSNCARYPVETLIPQFTLGLECGSNFSYPAVGNISNINHKTDVMTQARSVYSTFYQGQTHSPIRPNECSDAFDGVANDGYGLCTGTSMSAP